ncbi:hypothetical protein M011DRAFT_197683 [Sporormia fimetaria CBS 119925]|uniref:Uncharacterized protein n=1 Tax=Sporormia fimetaria CBS 119925 TaxID=1340428 RepID=A0A6A6V105_9PLEO|nr:hypothetical protein M011DRAFT_197683 [Sporormia fimetaria CBS 119925]
MIKVVPSFVNREFSVPPTSNLRPAAAKKRQRESSGASASRKRRHLRLQNEVEEDSEAANRPIPSTELENSGDERLPETHAQGARSKSQSVVQVRGIQTGREEFGPVVKEESPELGDPSVLPTVASKRLSTARLSVASSIGRSPDRSGLQDDVSEVETEIELPETENIQSQEDRELQDVEMAEDAVISDPTVPTVDNANHTRTSVERSPESSSPEPNEPYHVPQPAARRNIYDVSSSPEFLQSPSKRMETYGRKSHQSPRQRKSESREVVTKQRHSSPVVRIPRSEVNKARAAWSAKPDGIITSPQTSKTQPQRRNHIDTQVITETEPSLQTPQGASDARPSKTSSLKRPARRSYVLPPHSNSVEKDVTRPRRSMSTASRNADSTTTTAHKGGETTEITTSSLPNPTQPEQTTDKPPASSPVDIVRTGKSLLASLKQRKLERDAPAQDLSSSHIISTTPSGSPNYETSQLLSGVTQNRTLDTAAEGNAIRRGKQGITSTENGQTPPATADLPVSSPETFASSLPVEASTKRVPRRSEIPLPPPAHRPVGTPATGSKGKAKATKAYTDKARNHTEGLSATNDRRPSVSLNSSQITLPASGDAPRRQPRRSEIPLPQNVRGRFASSVGSVAATPNRTVGKVADLNGPLTSSEAHQKGRKQGRSDSTITPLPEKKVKAPIQPESSSLSDARLKSSTRAVIDESSDTSSDEDSGDEEVQEPNGKMVNRADGSTVESERPSDNEADEVEPRELDEAIQDDAALSLDLETVTAPTERSAQENNLQTHLMEAWEPTNLKDDTPARPSDQTSKQTPWDSSSWTFNGVPQAAEPTKDVDATEDAEASETEELEERSRTRSKSADVESDRSSPALSRGPARYLTHSPTPTPEKSDDEDEQDEDEDAAEAESKEPAYNRDDPDDQTSSDSSSTDSSDDDEDEDTEMPDAALVEVPATSQITPIPSSMPTLPSPLATNTQIQPQKSTIPLPSTKRTSISVSSTTSKPVTTRLSSSQIAPSSQTLTQSSQRFTQSARRPRSSQYPTITEQISSMRSGSAAAQRRRTFDPASQSLGTLKRSKLQASQTKGKANGKTAAKALMDDSSDDDSSSSSSSDDDEDAAEAKGAGCSVA